jgi:hypothetical protein
MSIRAFCDSIPVQALDARAPFGMRVHKPGCRGPSKSPHHGVSKHAAQALASLLD